MNSAVLYYQYITVVIWYHGGSVLVAIHASLQDVVKYTSIPRTHPTTNHADI